MTKTKRSGPCGDNVTRISAIFDVLKRKGRHGTYMAALVADANREVDERLQIRDLAYLHFVMFGRPKEKTGTVVGGYFRNVVEGVPGMPRSVRFVRLKAGVKKRAFLRGLRRADSIQNRRDI